MTTADVRVADAAMSAEDAAFLRGLTGLVGDDRVTTRGEALVFFSTDISVRGVTAEAVVRPKDVESLSRAVALCTAQGRYVIPRGAGYSYTEGYVPVRDHSVMFDLRDLDRIDEINVEDMFVTVECGCTWKRLYEALKEKGFRTPYFGPMSGYAATVGGALSQGSFFLGSTEYGTTAESTLGLEVVLADGSLLKTGSASSNVAPSPFFRTYGPDLTGPFLGDAGALGFKARATLKLIPFPHHQAFGTFPFDTMEPALKMVSDVGRLGLASECYCWDPSFVRRMAEQTSTLQNVKYLAGVVGSGATLGAGLKHAARLALKGRRVFDGEHYLVNVVIDDVSATGADEKLRMVRRIAAELGGGEIEASAPRATRGTPFINFNEGPGAGTALRNLPTNSLCPHSKAQTVAAQAQAFFTENQTLMEEHGVTVSVIFFAVGNNAVCIEPLFYWHDEEHRLHNRVQETSDLDGLSRFAERPRATEVAFDLRTRLVEIFRRNGCVHVQIGKAYPYRETRQAAPYSLLQAIKTAVDPHGLVNPGSLGLD